VSKVGGETGLPLRCKTKYFGAVEKNSFSFRSKNVSNSYLIQDFTVQQLLCQISTNAFSMYQQWLETGQAYSTTESVAIGTECGLALYPLRKKSQKTPMFSPMSTDSVL